MKKRKILIQEEFDKLSEKDKVKFLKHEERLKKINEYSLERYRNFSLEEKKAIAERAKQIEKDSKKM